MEREKVKQILRFVKDIDNEIAWNNHDIKRLEEQYYSMSGASLTESYIKSRNKVSRPTEATALNVPESESQRMRDLTARNAQLAKLKQAVFSELNKLPFPQKSIIHDFYIRGFQWVRISERINYSDRQCKNIRNRGLDKLAKHFSQNRTISGYKFPT